MVNQVIAIFLTCFIFSSVAASAQGNVYASEADRLAIERQIAVRGTADIIVDLNQRPEETLEVVGEDKAVEASRNYVAALTSRLNIANVRRILPLSPSFSATVSQSELDRLLADATVLSIARDRRLGLDRTAAGQSFPPTVSRSLQVIGASTVYALYGESGAGTIIALLDTGADADHPALSGRIVDEHCFSTQSDSYDSTCRARQQEDSGPGAARPCVQRPACDHGTATASVAAGHQVLPAWAGPYSDAQTTILGVAPLAHILPVQVMSLPVDGGAPVALVSDIRAALQFIFLKRNAYAGEPIVAVNMSLNDATDLQPGTCDTDGVAQDIARLRGAGVATVISAGNSSDKTQVEWPACISSALTVASVDLSDQPSSFSNFSPVVDYFAPGEEIVVAAPGGQIQSGQRGTSFAAPHVAGAVAAIRSWSSGSTNVDDVSRILRDSGKPITINAIERKRIDLLASYKADNIDRLFISGPQLGNIDFCDCETREIYLAVTSGNAAWEILESPPWLNISGLSGQAPNTITLFRGNNFETLPYGTTGTLRIHNLSAQQSDILVDVRKAYPVPAQASNFRLQQPEPDSPPMPWAYTISSDVVVGPDGRIGVLYSGFPPAGPGQTMGNFRYLYGTRGDNWQVVGLPPWFRAYPPDGGFFGGVPYDTVEFDHVGLDAVIAGLEPGQEQRASFSIVKLSEPDKPIQMTAVIQVSRPATADLFSVAPVNGPRFQGRRGGPFGTLSSTISIDQVAGNPRWEIYELPSWLRATPMSGVGTTAVNFTLAAEVALLPPGDYATYVVIRNRTGYQAPVARALTLVITP